MQLIHTNKFITNKLDLSLNREPLLDVSAIIYSHLQGVPVYTKRHIQR
jgi:hypothetical protein